MCNNPVNDNDPVPMSVRQKGVYGSCSVCMCSSCWWLIMLGLAHASTRHVSDLSGDPDRPVYYKYVLNGILINKGLSLSGESIDL
jgi:hypothetical protein